MTNITSFDFIVIGAGIAGASIAWSLAEFGRVALVERETHAGMHSTGRSAACYTEGYGGSIVRKLTRASKQFFLETPMGFAPTSLTTKRGVLHVAKLGSSSRINLLANELHQQRTSFIRGAGTEAIGAIPILRPEYAESCVFEPNAFEIDLIRCYRGIFGACVHGVVN